VTGKNKNKEIKKLGNKTNTKVNYDNQFYFFLFDARKITVHLLTTVNNSNGGKVIPNANRFTQRISPVKSKLIEQESRAVVRKPRDAACFSYAQ